MNEVIKVTSQSNVIPYHLHDVSQNKRRTEAEKWDQKKKNRGCGPFGLNHCSKRNDMDNKIRFHVLSILSICKVKFTHVFILLTNNVTITVYVPCIFSWSAAYKHQIARNQSAKARIKAIACTWANTTNPSTTLVVYWFVGVVH